MSYSAESDALVSALDALYDQHMSDAVKHRDIAIGIKDNPEKSKRHMRTGIAFKNRAQGVADAKHAIEALSETRPTPPEGIDQ